MSAPDCRYFDGCNCPICPEDPESLEHCAWFPDESICRRGDHASSRMVKAQKRIAKATGRAFECGCFTTAMLTGITTIGKGTRGLDLEEEITPERVKKWLGRYKGRREAPKLTEAGRAARQAALVKARAARKRAQEDYPSATGGDALTVRLAPSSRRRVRSRPRALPLEKSPLWRGWDRPARGPGAGGQGCAVSTAIALDAPLGRKTGPLALELFAVYPSLTDMGNAERFVNQSQADLRYCTLRKKWLAWDGKHWLFDSREAVVERQMRILRMCRGIAEQTDKNRGRDETLAWIERSESAAKVNAALALAQPLLSISPAELDKDPWLFSCANGTIDLRKGEIGPHDPTHFITRVSPVTFDPAAECPRWLSFLDEVFLGRGEIITFLQAWFGYCLTGMNTEHYFLILHGSGENGKTVLMNTILHVLGDFGREMPVELIIQKQSDGAVPNDLATLAGYRMVTFAESESGKHLAESRIKSISGGDQLTARFLFAEYFTFTPACKIILRTNHKPRILGTDHAIWRRIILVPFDFRVPPGRRDPSLTEKLKAEASGILNWLLRGCLRWQREGIARLPGAVEEATARYRADEDALGDFLAEKCIFQPGERTQSKVLYEAYLGHCQETGQKEISQKSFSATLEERGFQKERTSAGVFWKEIALAENRK
jgi:P4 family phage/plasmid primase-like protien